MLLCAEDRVESSGSRAARLAQGAGGARSRSLLAFQKALLQTVSTSSEAEAAGERVEYRLLRTLVTWLRAAVRRWRAAIWELIARVVGRRKE